jgi:hypothetical protein
MKTQKQRLLSNRLKTQTLKRFGIKQALACLLIGITSGCNVYEGFDSPKSNPQILEAARARLDQGDFAGAARFYAQLESSTDASLSALAHAENALRLLTQGGMDFGVFMSAVLSNSSSLGQILTELAGSLRTSSTTNPLGASNNYATRVLFFQAWQENLSLSSNTRLQGLVQLLSGMALSAEILAEQASQRDTTNDTGILCQGDLVRFPTTCTGYASNNPFIYQTNNCQVPTGSSYTLSDGAGAVTLSSLNSTTIAVAPTLRMLEATLKQILSGADQLGSAQVGSIAAQSSIFNFTYPTTTAGFPEFRYILVKTLQIGKTCP